MARDRQGHFDEDGRERRRLRLTVDWPELVAGLTGLDPDADYEVKVRREVIPVVLVPGLLGTRLQTSLGEPVWEPCDTLLPDAPGAHLMTTAHLRLGLVWPSLAQRRRLLVGDAFDPEHLRVADADVHRGLTSLAADAYGPALRRLERHPWSDLTRLCFRLPVHGFGYNWTDDHGRVGRRLARHIEDLVAHYGAGGKRCRRVILVAHGAGGLAARAACVLSGAEERVLGVFHGAQPALGAPALYHMLKAGFVRDSPMAKLAADLLGDRGDQVESLLGHMPGPMQLLPAPGYVDSADQGRWLRFEDADGEPVAGGDDTDAYERPERYWGAALPDGVMDIWRRLGHRHHPNSYHAAGRGRITAEAATYVLSSRGRKKRYGRVKLVPVGKRRPGAIMGEGVEQTGVHAEGCYSATVVDEDGVRLEVTLRPPAGDGDGVVPACSALAPAREAAAAAGGVSRRREVDGADHFGFFTHGAVLDHLTDAVEQMCQDHMAEQVEA